MNNKIKHLEMIQNIINRMAKDSFMVKGWSLTLTSIILALGSQLNIEILCLISFLPVLLFACLDAFYLQQERKYRNLYDIVRLKDEKDIDFDMKTRNDLDNCKFINCLASKSIVLFYVPIIITIVLVIVFIFV